ncbi:ornithine carbamoyltransferase [Natrinema pallidum]|uniref:Ornithine carbamoyltransferase n=2 Tax=Natrinema pallidum TaxID=69527 RepID=L9Z771_9EURY|nr:ornithine carbamoyltransferase [Natrinema pallidum]ELY82224.1 ornithine carbamoyltransferase [Natrinema pallidum DSM 3751]QCW04707.1 ornithine carbamoyltransferase [Natrinema pallidum]
MTTDSDPTHFLDIDDVSRDELLTILEQAGEYKRAQRAGADHADLDGQTLGMIFQKPSTRTRVSFETGMTQLGGHAVFLGEDDIQLGRGEPLKDTARTLSRYVDAVMARVFKHENAEVLAEYSSVPIVNGLTDDAHPCQTLADLLTIREHMGGLEDVSAVWIGDGNNVAQSFTLGAALTDIDLTVATPAGYGIDDDVLERARTLGGDPTVTTDPVEAVGDADIIYTDVWISMGQEDERDVRMNDFEGFQVCSDLLEHAPEASVMHCLPAHRGEEITDAVIEGDRSIVFDQAENRLHAQKALLRWLLE